MFLCLLTAYMVVRTLLVRYLLREDSIRVWYLGTPWTIWYSDIQSYEIIKASRLWRPLNVFVGGFGVRYLRSRSFVDSLVIETPATYFVLTPKNPHEFMQEVLRKRARLLPNSEEPPNHVKVFF